MSKIEEHEYYDAMNDYVKWQHELKILLSEEEPDGEEIKRVKGRIASCADALFKY